MKPFKKSVPLICVAVLLLTSGLACFEPSSGKQIERKIPKGFLARFEGVRFKHVDFEQRRWVLGEAKALNAHPFQLKFDMEYPQGTLWRGEDLTARDFSLTQLRLRGEQKIAQMSQTGVIGLGAGQWLRLTDAVIDESDLSVKSQKEAWVLSRNTWLKAPKGLNADLNKGEVRAPGPVRLEAFELQKP